MRSDQIQIHFAFPDGVLRYDCEACDSRCCKTGSLAVFPAEQEALATLHPALELVAPKPGGGISFFATPPSGCWFLQDKACTLLDSSKGHETTRPVGCTLFPFNLFGSLGNTLIVAPNGLCPLEIAPTGGVQHAEVLALLERVGAAGAPPAAIRPGEGEDLLALEAVIANAGKGSLEEPSPVPLFAFSALATAAFESGGVETLAALEVGSLQEKIDELYAKLDLFAEILGIDSPDNAALEAVAPTFAAWAPTLRLFGFPRVGLTQLPTALLGLSLYAAHWISLNRTRRLLPQTLLQMVSSLGPTIELLAAWNEPSETMPAPKETLARELATDPVERNIQLRRAARERIGLTP